MQQTISLPPSNKQTQKGRLTGKDKNQKKKRGKRGAKPRNPNKTKPIGRPNAEGLRRTEVFKLSPCSRLYLMALTNPFDLEGGKACIPDEFDIPSFKFLSVNRGTFVVGTLGCGFVSAKIHPANDVPAVINTTAAYPLTTFNIVGPGALAVNATNNPFQLAQFSSNGFQWRYVGAGLRVRYLGTELNRSGREIPYRRYTEVDVAGMGAAGLLARPEVPSIASRREWATVTMLPIGGNSQQVSDYEYSTTVPATYGTISSFTDIGFFVDGGVTGNAYEWEFYAHYEVAACRGVAPAGITPSHSDVPGISAIRNVLESNMPSGETAESDYQYYADLISAYTPDDMSHVLSGVVKAGKIIGPMFM